MRTVIAELKLPYVGQHRTNQVRTHV